jgi:hypothetical protein
MYSADKRAIERAERAMSDLHECIAELERTKTRVSLAMFTRDVNSGISSLKNIADRIQKTLLRHFPESEIAALPYGIGLLEVPAGLDQQGLRDALGENFERAKDTLAEFVTIIEKRLEALKPATTPQPKKEPRLLPKGGDNPIFRFKAFGLDVNLDKLLRKIAGADEG